MKSTESGADVLSACDDQVRQRERICVTHIAYLIVVRRSLVSMTSDRPLFECRLLAP